MFQLGEQQNAVVNKFRVTLDVLQYH